CRSIRYFASVLIGVRCQAEAIQVQPISTRRWVRSMLPKRVPPISLPSVRSMVVKGSAVPARCASSASSMKRRMSSTVRTGTGNQRKISPPSPTAQRASRWSSDSGWRQTYCPCRTTGSTFITSQLNRQAAKSAKKNQNGHKKQEKHKKKQELLEHICDFSCLS